MSSKVYLNQIGDILGRVADEQDRFIRAAAEAFADRIARGNWVYVFGSGHSVIPVLDVFPRYGSFVGFRPMMDPRLMWFNVVGPGGAPELLWIERAEGYIAQFLDSFELKADDAFLVFSHGGLNAAPVEAARYAKDRGLFVVGVTSGENHATREATHSSGQKLGDVADVLIDNCCPPEDAVVCVAGQPYPMAASSTVAFTAIVNALVAEVGSQLGHRGIHPPTFVSPNVGEVPEDNNQQVFAEYRRRLRS